MKRIKGFTLTELLAVIVIIAVLAAVALPMYNKNVEKIRASEALLNLKVWGDAVNRIYLANGGEYVGAADAGSLDISFPQSKYYEFFSMGMKLCTADCCGDYKHSGGTVLDLAAWRGGRNSASPYYLQMRLAEGRTYPEEVACVARSAEGRKLCEQIGAEGACQNHSSCGVINRGDSMCVISLYRE